METVQFYPKEHKHNTARPNSRGAREGLPTPLYPCFGMKSGGDRLSLRACKWFHTPGVDRFRRLAMYVHSIHSTCVPACVVLDETSVGSFRD